jgi:hypothetical protein
MASSLHLEILHSLFAIHTKSVLPVLKAHTLHPHQLREITNLLSITAIATTRVTMDTNARCEAIFKAGSKL